MRRLLLACATIALIGCGGSDSTGPAASAQGTWNLQTVNGAALPFTLNSNPSTGDKLEILDDQYVLNSDGTFTEAFTTRETTNGQITTTPETDNGTWTQQGSQVSVVFASGGGLAGTISNDKITIATQVGPLVYTRQ